MIGPLGFFLDNRELVRAGLDYKEFCSLRKHADWKEFWIKERPNIVQCYAFTTKTQRSAFEVKKLEDKAWLFFGSESKGLSETQKKMFYKKNLLRIPMMRQSRSLNLSNSVAIALYKFLQINQFINGDNRLS